MEIKGESFIEFFSPLERLGGTYTRIRCTGALVEEKRNPSYYLKRYIYLHAGARPYGYYRAFQISRKEAKIGVT